LAHLLGRVFASGDFDQGYKPGQASDVEEFDQCISHVFTRLS
jgi:hypothetical protein